MILQKLLAKSPKLEARLELLELATGLLLLGFLQFYRPSAPLISL